MPTPTIDAPTPTHEVIYAGRAGSPQAFAAAFQFLRSHSDGRYSDRTLMSVARWEGRCVDIVSGARPHPESIPTVHTISTTVSYDEETEVKRGGNLATAVALPSDGGFRIVMSVADSARRSGHGRELVTQLHRHYVNPLFWVGNSNVAGQCFLLHCGLYPQRMNGSGAVLFARSAPADEELVAR